MEKGKKENAWIILVVVLVLVIFGFWSMNKGPGPNNYNNQTDTNGTTVDSTEDTSIGSINTGAPAASISYQNALIKYKDARLQLDKVCQASPDKMTFKNGEYMMVDNRSALPRTVKVGSTFPLKAFGFKIVQVSSATLPTTWLVDCDTSQNVATVTIQK